MLPRCILASAAAQSYIRFCQNACAIVNHVVHSVMFPETFDMLLASALHYIAGTSISLYIGVACCFVM